MKEFSPEAALENFVARPARRPAPSPRRHAARHQADAGPPPFGTLRGGRVAYTVNLPAHLAGLLATATGAGGCFQGSTYGEVAVDAIRELWRNSQRTPGGAEPRFAERLPTSGRFDGTAGARRAVFYVTPNDATAIARVREAFGDVQVGRLHRAALERYLNG